MKNKGKIAYLWISMMLCFVMLVGCSASKSTSDYAMNATESSTSSEMKAEIAVDESPMAAQGETMDLSLNNTLNRKVIKTGELYIETKGFEQTINSITQKVEEIGGYIEGSNIEGNSYYKDTGRRYGELRVRIPNKSFDSFINQADSFGNVTSRSMQGEDVTDQYVDTEARLKSLEVQQTRLMELLEKSGSLEELFAIEKELAEVSYQIEQFKGTLNKYDSLIDYSTVSIYVNEVQVYQNTQTPITFGERMGKRFSQSIQGIKVFGEELILLFVGLMPVVIIVGIPVAIVVVIVLRIIKKKKENK